MQARVFPYNVTRSGSYSRYRFPLTCSKCGYEKEFEAPKIFPDSVVQKRFSQWGWVLGRNRSNDVCPRCLGVKTENHLANRYKVTHNGVPVLTPAEIAAVFIKAPEPILVAEESLTVATMVEEPEEVHETPLVGLADVVDELRQLRLTLAALMGPKVKKAPAKKTRAKAAVKTKAVKPKLRP